MNFHKIMRILEQPLKADVTFHKIMQILEQPLKADTSGPTVVPKWSVGAGLPRPAPIDRPRVPTGFFLL
jgi:hypothetical protein